MTIKNAILALTFGCLSLGHESTGANAQPSKPVIVFAAASLKDGLDEAAKAFMARGGTEIKVSYAGSLALARQLEQKAPADIFIAADQETMDYAASKSTVRSDTRFDFLTNRLVIVAQRSAPFSQVSINNEGLKKALGSGRIATGDTKSVPVGKYAMSALSHLGLWGEFENRLAMTDNVRAALLFVSRGEAPLGIVYATDAAADPSVKIVATFPSESHPPIVYPVALTADGKDKNAMTFIAYLRSPQGSAHFTKQGFGVVAQ